MKTKLKDRETRLNKLKECKENNFLYTQETTKARIAYDNIRKQNEIRKDANNAISINLYKEYSLRQNLLHDAQEFGFNKESLEKLMPLLTEKDFNKIVYNDEIIGLLENLELFLSEIDKDDNKNIITIEEIIRNNLYNDERE